MNYTLAVLLAIIAALGVRCHVLSLANDKLVLDYKTAETNALRSREQALRDQATAFGLTITRERESRRAAESRTLQLNTELAKLEDYHATTAESIRLTVNRMLDDAHDVTGAPRGDVPAPTAINATDRPADGHQPAAGPLQ